MHFLNKALCIDFHFFSYLEVFELDLQVPLVVHVFLSQEDGVAVVAGLAKYFDGDLDVKVHLALAALLAAECTGRQSYNDITTYFVLTLFFI